MPIDIGIQFMPWLYQEWILTDQDTTAYASSRPHGSKKYACLQKGQSIYPALQTRPAILVQQRLTIIPCIPLHTQLLTSIGSNDGVNPWIGPSHALVHEWWVTRPLLCTQELPDSSLRSSPPTIRYTTSISQKDPREQSSPRRHAGAALPKEAGNLCSRAVGGGCDHSSMRPVRSSCP